MGIHNWINSRADCAAANGDLVSITSEEEQIIAYTATMGDTSRSYWIGGSDRISEGTFLWVTDETLDGYENWAPGQPGVEHNLSDCMVTSLGGAQWQVTDCNAGTGGAICERTPAGIVASQQ